MIRKLKVQLVHDVKIYFEQILEAAAHKNSSYTATYLPSRKLSK